MPPNPPCCPAVFLSHPNSLFVFVFETGSHVAQAGFELTYLWMTLPAPTTQVLGLLVCITPASSFLCCGF